MEELVRLRELHQSGLCCAQSILQLGLECLGEEAPGAVRALGGLGGGVRKGLLCGAVSGAACLLSYVDPETAKTEMIPQLVEWFQETFGKNGTDCLDILEGDRENRFRVCPPLVERVFLETREILEEYGYDLPLNAGDRD